MPTTSLLSPILLLLSLVISTTLSLPKFHTRPKFLKQDTNSDDDNVYRDEDGTTTSDAQAAFVRRTRICTFSLLVLSVLGLGTNIAAAVLIRADLEREDISDRILLLLVALKVSAAFLLAFQSVVLALTSHTTSRQSQLLLYTLSNILVYSAHLHVDALKAPSSHLHLAFLLAHLLLLVTTTLTPLLLPRRPRVYRNGDLSKPIDSERTVPLLSRYTLSWATPLLATAVRNHGLRFADLPFLTTSMSTGALVAEFNGLAAAAGAATVASRKKLWKLTVRAHRSVFVTQWLLTLASTLATLAPQYFLWRLIRILEQLEQQGPRSSATGDPRAALWLALLGLAQLVQPWVETWLLWVGWVHVALPIYVQLSGSIVEKTLRKKDVKEVRGAGEERDGEVPGFENLDAARLGKKGKSVDGAGDDDDDDDGKKDGDERGESTGEKKTLAPKSMQDQTNLISVDVQRVTDFLSYNAMIVGTFLSILISFVFLLSIMRYQSILAGMLGISFIVPLNVFANRRYATAQKDLMNARDLKTAALTEGIQGIRQIKYDALEPQWSRRLNALRHVELSHQWRAYIAETLLMMSWIAGPILFAAITLSTISIYEGGISPSTTFTALAIFQRLEGTLSIVPGLVTDFFDAWVSFDRIEQFLFSPERTDTTVDAELIAFEGACIAWPSDEGIPRQPTLHSLDFKFPRNELSIIAGPTGVGKSLLLAAMIGEADLLSGTIRRPRLDLSFQGQGIELSSKQWIIPKAISFVAQTPWIEGASLRDNILFGLPLSESRYTLVLQACALMQDIAAMEDRDKTELGAHGISLSGGQRSRLALARALYSRAEVLIIDDIFSSVDAHVGRHLLDHALAGDLAKDRTFVVATHHIELCLSRASFVVMLNKGTADYAGETEPLLRETDILVDDRGTQDGLDHSEYEAPLHTDSPQSSASLSDDSSISLNDPSSLASSSQKENGINVHTCTDKIHTNTEAKRLIQEEQHQSGRTKFYVYKEYLRAASAWPWVYWVIVVTLLVGFEVVLVERNWWVKSWSEESSIFHYRRHAGLAPGNASAFNDLTAGPAHVNYSYKRNNYYVIGCFGISVLIAILGTFKFFWVYIGSIRASELLFDKTTEAVLHAPLRWLDTVPTGRILNRFIADFNVIDSSLANDLVLLVYCSLQLAGIIVAGSIVTPLLLVFAVALLALCIAYARQYLAGARDVKRLESIKRSPVFEQLESLLSGLPTIRACNKSHAFINRMYSKIDDHARCVWHLWLFNRWLGIRFALIGAVFTLIVASFAVYSPGVSASLAGLALSFSLEFTQSVFWVLRRYADVEMDMNSLERISEFCAIPTEPSDGKVPPAHWPSSGQIEIRDLMVGYSADSPPVLRGVSFACDSGSRVGIVGRTGAGKSSLTLALFRFLEARSGSIFIGGLDISTLALRELRGRIAIIPQHPVLWLGTIRSNLDPFGAYDDTQLKDALERVHLSELVTPMDASSEDGEAYASGSPIPSHSCTLSMQVSESGLNLSLGQRQLVCLARALLSQPKILIMDEATSAVDMDTDAIVQRSIRSELKNCTLIVIAHKLSTVIDLDKIVVLEAGQVVEMGAPKELWEKGGMFSEMVKQSGERNLLEKLT